MEESLVVCLQGGNSGRCEGDALAGGQWPSLSFCLVLAVRGAGCGGQVSPRCLRWSIFLTKSWYSLSLGWCWRVHPNPHCSTDCKSVQSAVCVLSHLLWQCGSKLTDVCGKKYFHLSCAAATLPPLSFYLTFVMPLALLHSFTGQGQSGPHCAGHCAPRCCGRRVLSILLSMPS